MIIFQILSSHNNNNNILRALNTFRTTLVIVDSVMRVTHYYVTYLGSKYKLTYLISDFSFKLLKLTFTITIILFQLY